MALNGYRQSLNQISQPSMPMEYTVELKATPSHSVVSTEPSVNIESILDSARFSTFSRLIRVTVQVLRAIQRFKSLTRRKATAAVKANTVEEAIEAELLWV